MDAKSKLMAYLKGWRAGACFKAIQFEDNEDYVRGYREGRAAYNQACEAAQHHYGAKLSILRTQETERADG